MNVYIDVRQILGSIEVEASENDLADSWKGSVLPMQIERCDYLIIGGGAAGCALGYLLRKAGADVLILERLDAEKKDKLCAEMISNWCRDEIVKIFGADAWLSLNAEPITFTKEYFGGYEVTSKVDYFYAMPRKSFDDYFLRRYLEVGGQIKDLATVRKINTETNLAECLDLRTKKFFHIRFGNLIGADGATSTVRKLITGKKPRISFAVESVIPLIGKDIIFDFLPDGSVGYRWYIPRRQDATVGAVYFFSHTNPNADYVKSCREWLSDFCRSRSISLTQPLRGACLPAGNDVLLRAGEKIYFIGDAAGLIGTPSGAGIPYALVSARRLAESFLGGISYKEAMQHIKEKIIHESVNARTFQFLNNFRIIKQGRQVE